jgi:hypothetical protein
MLFAIYPETAEAAGVKQIQWDTLEQPHMQIGNSMSVGKFCVLVTSLSVCFGPAKAL